MRPPQDGVAGDGLLATRPYHDTFSMKTRILFRLFFEKAYCFKLYEAAVEVADLELASYQTSTDSRN